jgi:hypothetical protein
VTRYAPSLAVALFACTVLLMGLSAALTRSTEGAPPSWLVPVLVVFLVCDAFVGMLVAVRQPANAVGWLFLWFAFGLALNTASSAYASLGLPAGGLAELTRRIGAIAFFASPLLAIALFPDGRLPSRRFRVIWIPVLGQLVLQLLQLRSNIGIVVYLAGAVIAVAAPLARYRSARGVTRLQLKWFFYAAGIVLVSTATLLLATASGNNAAANAAYFAMILSINLVPIAAGIAILRYRLYDIDLLIKRTVVYGATSAAIAATFWVGILVLQALLQPLTSGSELAVAASTLVSFALFQPVRRRVQAAVDRRFDRARYDAVRTLDVFADRLRDEVDLDALRVELLQAVGRTMSPTHTSLWLRTSRQ